MVIRLDRRCRVGVFHRCDEVPASAYTTVYESGQKIAATKVLDRLREVLNVALVLHLGFIKGLFGNDRFVHTVIEFTGELHLPDVDRIRQHARDRRALLPSSVPICIVCSHVLRNLCEGHVLSVEPVQKEIVNHANLHRFVLVHLQRFLSAAIRTGVGVADRRL